MSFKYADFMKKETHHQGAAGSSRQRKLSAEEREHLGRYLDVVGRIYEHIKDTPLGEQLRLKAQW